MAHALNDRLEWLEADGLGGFASGTATGIRTRRYHALLLAAAAPPTARQVLVAGMDAEVTIGDRRFALSSQRYAPGVIHPDGAARLTAFVNDPWPRWTFDLGEAMRIEQALLVPKGLPATILTWRSVGLPQDAKLAVRPFFAGRDYHSTMHANDAVRLEPVLVRQHLLRWTLYDGVQPIIVSSNGTYRHAPDWYRNFEYVQELARGLDGTEDLASAGAFEFEIGAHEAVLILAAATPDSEGLLCSMPPRRLVKDFQESERQRRLALGGALDRAADAYVVRRASGATLIAGYPWFTDWGRDTFIALRGICLATGRLAEARQVLLAWANAVSDGMLPNRFPDAGEAAEFNAVDASLWFIVAAHEYLLADSSASTRVRKRLRTAIERILDGYSRGTRYGIRMAEDGLLAAGVTGVQLTWMDARARGHEVTPRIGKPVEVQALWINALYAAAAFDLRWKEAFSQAFAAFEERFWNERDGALYDVVDVDHVAGTVDASFRPNQILAVGGLPLPLLAGTRARRVVDNVEARLWTPAGLRSLAPDGAGYTGRYAGGVDARDGAYHQGTVWPWLLGPFVEAWVRTRPDPLSARATARERFLTPLLEWSGASSSGHVPEVADGDAPHAAGGCPFQAWSIGEVLRLDRVVLAAIDTSAPRRHRKAEVATT